jgi:hypothetical protein
VDSALVTIRRARPERPADGWRSDRNSMNQGRMGGPDKELQMSDTLEKQRRLHYDVMNVELRAQATAVGFVQLCIELQDAGILETGALDRIKDAIADEVSVTAPRYLSVQDYRREIRARLERLFVGEQAVGSAEALSFGNKPT